MSLVKKLYFLCLLFPAVFSRGQTTNIWNGGGANNNWSTAANWGGIAPVSGNGLTFSGTTRQANSNDISGLANLSAISFTSAGWNIVGNSVAVTNGFSETATGSNTWGLPTTLSSSITINQSASGDILNFTGILSGSSGISTVAGAGGVGTIYLSNPSNSFTGSVTINSATAVFYTLANGGQNSSFGAGTGAITFGSTATSYEASLVYAGTNNATTGRAFQAEARTTGSPTFNNNSPNNSSLVFNGGWSGRADLNPFAIILQGTSTGTNTFNGAISQPLSPFAVSLQVNGPGTWIFAANNTYTGTTSLNGGILQLGSGGTTGNAGLTVTNNIIFSTSGTLAIDRSDSPVFVNPINLSGTDTFAIASGTAVTLGGVISGAGEFINDSPGGTVTFTNANTYAGNTIVAAGKLVVAGSGSIVNSPVIALAAGAVLDVSSVNGGFSLNGGQTLSASGATGTINGSLNLGSGALDLSYSAGTPVITVTGGAFNLNNNAVTIAIPGNTTLAVGSYQLIATGAGGSVTGSVASSLISINQTNDPSLALVITNGGLYLVVNPSTAAIPTVVSVSGSPNPEAYGTVPVTLCATVSPAPTNGETVTFMAGANNLGSVPLTNGSAVLQLGALAIGSHSITAFYGGDGLYLPGTSGVFTQIVNEVAIPYPQGPAFPLFMYEIDPTYTNLIGYGWNNMQEYGLNTNSDVNNFLEGLLPNNVAGPAVIPDTGTNDPYTGWTQSAVQSWVQSIDVNTNLAWWYLPEEMSPNYPSETNLLNNYTAWTRLYDPGKRPTYEYTENSLADLAMAGIIPYPDVIGVSCYCEDLGMPHAWVRYKLQQVGGNGAALAGRTLGSNYLAGQKTLVAVLSIAQFSGNTPSEPSPAQTYHDFWSAIASGAQGIAVWSYYHALNDDPANLTNNLNELSLAASQITGPENVGNMILGGTLNSGVTFQVTSGPTKTVSFQPLGESTNFQYPSLNLLSKTWNGSVYLIAVNSTSSNVSATVSNLPTLAATANVPFESRSVAITHGSFSDSFSVWGVHIYTMPAAGSLVAPLLYSTVASASGSFTLNFSGMSGQTFRLLASTNLALPLASWTVLTNGTFGVNLVTFTDNAATKNCEFYRVASP